jgi:hypothetical protein
LEAKWRDENDTTRKKPEDLIHKNDSEDIDKQNK